MPQGPNLRAAVLAVREQLASERTKLQKQHASGSPGIQVCAHLTEVLDRVLLELLEDAIEASKFRDWRSRLAVVPHGGFGRRDVAPFSDVDLLLLYDDAPDHEIAPLARLLLQNVFDSGLKLGFAPRTEIDAVGAALGDATIFTSLAESRFLAGNRELFARFRGRLQRKIQRRSGRLIHTIEAARMEERQRFGETTYLLEPNVKRSRGGLRDIQLMRWVAFAGYGFSDLESLMRAGHLNTQDYWLTRNAREFLLRLRNELHFHAGRSQDVLTRDEQLRIAAAFGYEGSAGELPVEDFMRRYFAHTTHVRYASAHLVAKAKPRSRLVATLEPVFSHRVGRDFLVGPRHIRATPRGMAKVTRDVAEILRLMDLANLYDKRIEHTTWQNIREAMLAQESLELSDDAVNRFMSLLSQPPRLANLLRRLHEMGVLEKLVPAVGHARYRVQFNEYHKYTVDEHSLLAVQRATEFLSRGDALGDAYRSIRSKSLLHLALLLHDLGKGHDEDHSNVGLRIAEEMGYRLRLPSREREMLKVLVHKHLIMADLAFRHDLNDEATTVQLAVEVGSAYMLQMLYVLSAADLAAVGPGVLNDWKLQLLSELYLKTRRHLTQDDEDVPRVDPVAERRRALTEFIPQADTDPWWSRTIRQLPLSYLLTDSPEQLAAGLTTLRELPADQALAWGRYLPERKAVAYTVGARAGITAGIFYKLTGRLSSQRLEILSAEIYTLGDELVLDRFFVEDMDYDGPPPESRLAEVCVELQNALTEEDYRAPTFRRVWQPRQDTLRMSEMPTRVRFDNSTSERFTILTVFTYDRRGLLYDIARTLFLQGLSVHVAKIATYVDQIADVFYVSDATGGNKILEEERMDRIRQALLKAIEV